MTTRIQITRAQYDETLVSLFGSNQGIDSGYNASKFTNALNRLDIKVEILPDPYVVGDFVAKDRLHLATGTVVEIKRLLTAGASLMPKPEGAYVVHRERYDTLPTYKKITGGSEVADRWTQGRLAELIHDQTISVQIMYLPPVNEEGATAK